VRFALVSVCLAGLAACRPPGWGKEVKPDASSDVDGGGSATTDAALDTPQALTCDHAFRVDGQSTASSVWLTGSFVAWAANPGGGAIELEQGIDGAWTGSYAFGAGTHQYKFVVDGSNWILDATNPNTADDGMGHTNSVYTCVP